MLGSDTGADSTARNDRPVKPSRSGEKALHPGSKGSALLSNSALFLSDLPAAGLATLRSTTGVWGLEISEARRLKQQRLRPEEIRVDDGPEFRQPGGVGLVRKQPASAWHIQPKPMQDGHIERFNGRLRDECLNANWFTSLSGARRKIEASRKDYNEHRPHSAPNYHARAAGPLFFPLLNKAERGAIQGFLRRLPSALTSPRSAWKQAKSFHIPQLRTVAVATRNRSH